MTTHARRRMSLIALLTALAMIAVACGGDDGDTADDDAGTPDAAATDDAADDAQADDAADDDAPADDAADAAEDDAPADDGAPAGDVETDVGVTDTTITVATLTDLTGPTASSSRIFSAGFEAYFQTANADGGIAGRQVEVLVEDTQYNPEVGVSAYQAVRDQVVAVQAFGTPIVQAIRSLAAQDSTFIAPGSNDSGFLADPNIALFAPSNGVMTASGVDYLLDEHGEDVAIGMIWQADDLGAEHLYGIEVVQETRPGFELVADTSVGARDEDFTAAVVAMQNAGAEYVLLGVSPGALAGIVGTAASLGYDATFVNLGAGYGSALLETPVGPALEEQLISTCWFSMWDEDVPGMEEIRAAHEEYAGDLNEDVSFIFGWTQAKVIAEGLRIAAENGDMTRAGLVEAIHSIENLDMGDVAPPFTYGPEPADRIPYREMRMCDVTSETVDGWVPITDWFLGHAAAEVGVRDA